MLCTHTLALAHEYNISQWLITQTLKSIYVELSLGFVTDRCQLGQVTLPINPYFPQL